MGMFDNVLGQDGTSYQTKAGGCYMMKFQPGDGFPVVGGVAWISLVEEGTGSDPEEYWEGVGLVLDGVWTGRVLSVEEATMDRQAVVTAEASRELTRTMKTRNAELMAVAEKARAVVRMIETWVETRKQWEPGEVFDGVRHFGFSGLLDENGVFPEAEAALNRILEYAKKGDD